MLNASLVEVPGAHQYQAHHLRQHHHRRHRRQLLHHRKLLHHCKLLHHRHRPQQPHPLRRLLPHRCKITRLFCIPRRLLSPGAEKMQSSWYLLTAIATSDPHRWRWLRSRGFGACAYTASGSAPQQARCCEVRASLRGFGWKINNFEPLPQAQAPNTLQLKISLR